MYGFKSYHISNLKNQCSFTLFCTLMLKPHDYIKKKKKKKKKNMTQNAQRGTAY